MFQAMMKLRNTPETVEVHIHERFLIIFFYNKLKSGSIRSERRHECAMTDLARIGSIQLAKLPKFVYKARKFTGGLVLNLVSYRDHNPFWK